MLSVSTPTVLIGRSRFITQFVALASRISSVLAVAFSGPPGSGKSLFARYLHEAGPLSGERIEFWRPPTLGKQGVLRAGEGCAVGKALRDLGRGTLVVEDVDRLSRGEQAILLRFLDSGELSDVSPPTKGLSIRVVVTTRRAIRPNRPGPRARPGFWYGFPHILRIPPLGHRPEDLDLIARACANGAGRALGRGAMRITPSGIALLLKKEWPGNVRQLIEVVNRACARAEGSWVDEPELAWAYGG